MKPIDPTRTIYDLSVEIQKAAGVARRDYELLETEIGQTNQAVDKLTDQIGIPRAPARASVALRLDWVTKQIAEFQKRARG